MEQIIGFIGIGAMGSHMSRNLLNAGYKLVVYDNRAEAIEDLVKAGAKKASSPRELAERSSIVITMLPASPDVEAVILGADGVINGITPGNIVVDMSSSHPTSTKMVCDLEGVNYTITSSTVDPGLDFNWTRAAVGNIANPAGSGSGSLINENLDNEGTEPVDVVYLITPVIDTCTGPVFPLTVTVNPTPVVTSVSRPATATTATVGVCTLFRHMEADSSTRAFDARKRHKTRCAAFWLVADLRGQP